MIKMGRKKRTERQFDLGIPIIRADRKVEHP